MTLIKDGNDSQAADGVVRASASSQVWLVVRRVAASLLLLILIGGSLLGWFESCTSKVAAGKVVEKTCAPPQVTDASVIAIALGLVALMWPEVSEIDILGFALKRQIREVEKDAKEGIARTKELEQLLAVQSVRMDTMLTSVSYAQAAASVGDILIGDAAIKRSLKQLPEKRQAYLDPAGPSSIDRGPQELSESQSARGLHLIADWELIQSLLRDKSASEQDRFNSIFDEEMRIIRATRNAIAHARPVADGDLQDSLRIASEVLSILQDN